MASQYNQVTFKVSINSSKPEIKKAVERIFGVQVIGINTIRVKGKLKKFNTYLVYVVFLQHLYYISIFSNLVLSIALIKNIIK